MSMKQPKQYRIFKDEKYLFDTDTPETYRKEKYEIYIDTRYPAKLRLYNYMTKKEKEALKSRQTEILRGQIEKLFSSCVFSFDEIVDVVREVMTGNFYTNSSEMIETAREITSENYFVLESPDILTEKELTDFCKLKCIKIWK